MALSHDERMDQLRLAQRLVSIADDLDNDVSRRFVLKAAHGIFDYFGGTKSSRKGQVLATLQQFGDLTRGELIEMLGFNKGSFDAIVQELEAEGKIITRKITPATPYRGGRPRILVILKVDSEGFSQSEI